MAGLYIHIPYCKSKCAYCDFYSTPSHAGMESYVAALLAELRLRLPELNGESITTVYIGGGTPSILPDSLLKRLAEGIFAEVERSDSLMSVEEFTIEANPDDIARETLQFYRSIGINRVSIGIQTFDDGMLASLGRRHDSNQASEALTLLADSGFNYSADLIYGLPGQSLEDWRRQLTTLLSYKPPHFSSYLLSYEQGTRLYARLISGKVEEASEELALRMYNVLTEGAAAAGYEHYEISNFCLPGSAAMHNSSYWNLTPYLGLGVSAHSFDGRDRRFNPLNIKSYVDTVGRGEVYCQVDEETDADRLNDYIITSLRTADGLDLGMLNSFPGELRKEFLANLSKTADMLQSDGNKLRIAERDWLRSDAIFRNLIL